MSRGKQTCSTLSTQAVTPGKADRSLFKTLSMYYAGAHSVDASLQPMIDRWVLVVQPPERFTCNTELKALHFLLAVLVALADCSMH